MKFARLALLTFLALPLVLFLSEPVTGQVLSARSGKIIDLATVRASDRVVGVIDEQVSVSRPGNRHPLARPEFDAGLAPAATRMDRMLLVLQPDANQQEALEALLEAQQDRRSPQYHQWLSPEAFGRLFGVSERDVDRVVGWLESHGFQVEPVSSARRQIVFSGTAAEVQSAFHTEVHFYQVQGEVHYANAADPEIPQALAEVIGGVVSLHNFQSKPMHSQFRPARAPAPEYTTGGSNYLAPADFATIYDSAATYAQSIDGSGQSIAVVARSDYNPSDVQMFRSQFGLPVNNPSVIVNGADPGIGSQDEQGEATLDVEWSGAVAPKAAIKFVVSASTNSSDGTALSAQYIVDNNVAPVVSMSFGLCEAALGTAGNQFWNSLWQQAASQGMTVLVAAGDSGAAGCDSPASLAATGGQSVNGICSSPYSTCVGGTEFADTSNPNLYWSANPNPTTLASALSYIPETVWNESGTTAGDSGLWAGGGGPSQVYPKPAWQTGPGVPADGRRDVPDVSLTSAIHDGYLVALNGQFYSFGGTSAATPAFAALMALVNQNTQARQGNANPTLYALAALQVNGGAGIFHDITTGNNSVPGQTGFSATAGYDAASGLGSVDASVLVNHWNDASAPTPAFQLSASSTPVSLAPGANTSTIITASVSGGFNAALTFSASALPSGLTASFTPATLPAPGSGSVTLNLTAASTLAPGSYSITVNATGGGLSESSTLPVTIAQNCTYSLGATSANVPAGGGNFTGYVTTQAGCSWTATSNTPWISVTGGSPGSGSGQMSYSVTSNNSLSSRSGSLTIAGQTLTLMQAGASAVFTLSAPSANFAAAGGTGGVALWANPSNASWQAVSNASWITITKNASGTGSKTVRYAVARNSGAARSGTLTIAGLTFTVNQAAATDGQSSSNCVYQVAAGAITPTAQGYSGSVSVQTSPGCQWTATSNVAWLTVEPGYGGSGNGTVQFLAAFNTKKTARSGILSVAGTSIGLTEPGR